jgi:hypothetical protein
MDDKTKGINVERTSGRSDEYISGREALDTDGRIGERGTSRIPSRTTPASTGTTGGPSDTTSNAPGSSAMDAPTEERTREIRAEIEQTRGEMSETVNAIQDRLRPSNIASNAAEGVKSTAAHAAESVRNLAGDKAQAVAGKARNMADSEPVQYARANPIPTAMIGIGIAGITWMALGGREARSQQRHRRGGSPRDWRRLAPYDEGARSYRGGTGYAGQSGSGFGDAGFGEAGYPGQSGFETAAAYTPELIAGSRDAYSAEGRMFGRSEDEGRRGGMGRSAQDLRRRAQQTTRQAQRTLQSTWRRNPLMMGACSAVLGFMVGMAVPETEAENEYMGEARDNAIEGVQQSVRDTVQKVQNAASSAVGLVSGEQNQQSGNQQQRQQAQQTQQGQGQPATTGESPNRPGTQGSQSDSQGRQGQQPGSQTQAPGGTGQPPKNPGIA